MSAMKTVRAALLLIVGVALGGCPGREPPEPATVSQGACDAFEAPDFYVRGKTKKDQHWINKTVERGVRVCNWPRPAGETK
jgi:hypothetical protein